MYLHIYIYGPTYLPTYSQNVELGQSVTALLRVVQLSSRY